MFWQDNWKVDGLARPFMFRFLRLFSYVLNDKMSALEVYSVEDLSELFYRPLSTQAFQELQTLKSLMHHNQLSETKDEWHYCWGESYSAKQFYDHIHAHILVPKVYTWLWKSSYVMKTKVFAWLLLVDRLNTRDLLRKRHWNVNEDNTCVLCPSRVYEDRIHLFFHCNFSARIWTYLQIEWQQHDDLQVVLNKAKRSFQQSFFMEVIITACWNIWLIRNGRIFRQENVSFARWKAKFVHDMFWL
jgi:hypothetical protein